MGVRDAHFDADASGGKYVVGSTWAKQNTVSFQVLKRCEGEGKHSVARLLTAKVSVLVSGLGRFGVGFWSRPYNVSGRFRVDGE